MLLGTAIEGTAGIRYHLRQLLGEGGQGWVYKANYDDPDGFWVVVKILRPDDVHSDTLKRFEREAEVLRMLGSSSLPNPNIVRFYDHGTHLLAVGGAEISLPFICLEFVDGQTLGKVIESHGGFGLPIVRVRRILKQVARALSTVHDRRIIHRDLKPSNILLTHVQDQEVVKVTDFGLVKLPELSSHKTVTVAGASLGYAPPEQYEMGNNRVSIQTDVFAFGAILYEMLSGNEAFPCKPGDNPLRIVARMLSGEPPSLAKVSATIPHELRDRPDLLAAVDREIARSVHADPAHRHPTIRELWERVEPLLRDAASRGGYSEDATFDGSGSGGFPGFSMPGHVGSSPVVSPIPGQPIAGDGGRHGAPVIAPHSPPVPAMGAVVALQHSPSAPPVRGSHIRASAAPEVAPGSGPTGSGTWRMIGRPMPGERLRGAVVAPDGRSIVAVGARGLYHFARGVWSTMALPPRLEPRTLRGAVRLVSGELLVYGEAGLVLALATSGSAEALHLPDRDITLLGAHADRGGLVLVGERLSRPGGVFVHFRRPEHAQRWELAEILNVPFTTRLHAVTRVQPTVFLACGVRGDLVEIAEGVSRDVPWGKTGHLYSAISAGDGIAFAVGSGGHALHLEKKDDRVTRATLEAVQTTRDITAVTLAPDGSPWAVGGQARLLHRKALAQPVWARIALDPIAQGSLVGVSLRPDGITVLGEDGLVLEGRGIA